MKRLSVSQIDVLHLLDDRGMVTLPGCYSRTARVLERHGLAKPLITKYRGQTTVTLAMTKKGKDFVYNGGLDVPHPVV